MAELSTRQLEHGLALLEGLDLGSLFKALFSGADPGLEEIQVLVPLLGSLGQRRTLRKLAAVMAASEEELQAAETNKEKLAALEAVAAAQPWSTSMAQVKDFFTGLGLSLPATSAFSAPPAKPEPPAEGSPSAV